MCFGLVSCGGNERSEKTPNEPTDVVQLDNKPEETPSNSTKGDNKDTICNRYEAFTAAQKVFEDFALEKSHDHEIVSVNFSVAMHSGIRTLHYMIPIAVLETSVGTIGKFDASIEEIGLNAAWGDNAKITENGDGSYVVVGDYKEDTYKLEIEYDRSSDALRMEGYKNEKMAIIFEYFKTADGYAAQYYYEDVKSASYGKQEYEFRKYLTVFSGKDGAWARFDGVTEEPSSIIGQQLTIDSIVEGADHYYILKDGQFSGQLSGESF